MASVLQLDSVSKNIGDLVLFENISIQLNEGDKAALVGVNGSGKTTLLNCIAGFDSPSGGSIIIASGATVTYLPQNPMLNEEHTVMQALFQSQNEQVLAIREYEEAMISHDLKRIEHSVVLMDHLKLWDYENRVKQMLSLLDVTDLSQKIADLSGGQRKRIAIANCLLNEPALLLLDEPTNHLDLALIEWIENYLLRSPITLLMVTHDRFFLDRVCNTILEIDQKKLHKYEGNFSRFLEQREKRIEIEQQEVDRAQNLLRKEEDWMSRMPKARSTKAKYRIDNYYKLKDVSLRRRDDKTMKINVQESRMGSKILVAKNLNFKWGDDFFLRDFTYTFSKNEKIGIIGGNGIGKSTFLEIVTGNLKPESGIIETGETIKYGYYRQKGLAFDENMRVLDALTEIAEAITLSDGTTVTASQFLTYFLFPHARQYDYISKLSGGERRRLYLCSVLMQNPNFLILDEPTNDLDIATLEVLEDYLHAFSGCVLVVSHDRYFMDHVVDHIFVFEGEGRIKDFPGNYSVYFDWKKDKLKAESEQQVIEKKEKPKPLAEKKLKMTFKEKKELEQVEADIAKLESKKANLELELSSGKLNPAELTQKSQELGTVIKQIEEKSNRWLELSEIEG